MTIGILILAAGFVLLAAAVWGWLRPRHGRHEIREHAAGIEADTFIAALRDAPAPADERLADTDVRRRFWQPPASPPAPAAQGVRLSSAEPGAGATTWAQDPAAVVYPRTPPGPLPRIGIVIPPRAVPDVWESCWCQPGCRRGHLPEWAAEILHHQTVAEAVEADSMIMPAVSIDA